MFSWMILTGEMRSYFIDRFGRVLFLFLFSKASRRVLPENPLNTDTSILTLLNTDTSILTLLNTYTSTLTLTHLHFDTHTVTHTYILEERKHLSVKYARVKVCKCEYARMQ